MSALVLKPEVLEDLLNRFLWRLLGGIYPESDASHRRSQHVVKIGNPGLAVAGVGSRLAAEPPPRLVGQEPPGRGSRKSGASVQAGEESEGGLVAEGPGGAAGRTEAACSTAAGEASA